MNDKWVSKKDFPILQKELADCIPGGLGVFYVYSDNSMECKYLNDSFYSIMGTSREESREYFELDFLNTIHSENRTELISQLRKAITSNEKADMNVSFTLKSGKNCWCNIQATVAEQMQDKTVMYFLFTNVDELFRAHLLAKESRSIIQIASKNGNMVLWTYHIDSHHITQVFVNEDRYFNQTEIEGGYEEIIRAKEIHQDDVETFRDMYLAIDNGAEISECTVRAFCRQENRYEWRHMTLSRTHDEINDSIAIGSSVNAELQKEAEARYEREVELRRELMKDAVIYYRINLTTHMVEELYSEAMDTRQITIPITMEDLTAKGLFSDCYENDYELLSGTLNPENMLNKYESGKRDESITYRRYIPGKGLRWLKASITKLKRVDTDEVIAFFTAIDIDEEMKDRILYRDVMDEEIESIITLKVNTRKIRVLKENRSLYSHGTPVLELHYFSIDDEFRKGLVSDILSNEKESAAKFIETDSVIEGLKSLSVLQHVYSTQTDSGETRRKKVRVFYLDETKQDIIFVRRDITDLFNEQERQNAALKRAMDETKAANEAKSIFFSRMSHDMRTPLNAIIGYSGDVLRENASEKQKDEFLDDIHSSGKYLLGIINDVLDMSKIENKKMSLHPEPYTCKEFRKSLETVVLPLCQKKNIQFALTMPPEMDVPFMVDKVRFNQIFVNILSNSVKFTAEDGKVSMTAACIGQSEQSLDMEFTVADTGCGMSEEFIPHAFDSFSQEYEGQRMHKEQGTGLGLSIVKQLVELMNGTIRIESKINVGSKFMIRMQIQKANGENIGIMESLPKNALNGLRILLCEDHPMNRDITIRLLEKEGCIVDAAEDGSLGVQKFIQSAPDYYSAILMDVRMPNMDGLEATRAIRKLSRTDAKDIPIVAMTANAFLEDRRESINAGMDAHLSKPVNPHEMYSILYKLTKGRHFDRKPKILVVDDIEMNAVLVAKALEKQYETIVVLSGEEALEHLADNPYIIAVITDIQMPEMDGSELIRRIRSNTAYNRIAIIANTQFGDSHLEEKIMHDGADDFIYKPTAPSVILSRVENVLSKYR